MSKGRIIGAAFTAKGREQKAVQKVVTDTGIDPEHLKYVEDKRSKTAKVVDPNGKTKGRFSW